MRLFRRFRIAMHRARWGRKRRTPRELAVLLAPWVALLVGLAVAFVSAIPDVDLVGTSRIDAAIPGDATESRSFDPSGASYVQATVEAPPSCALRVYLLDEASASAFLETDQLPDPGTSLNCDRPAGVHPQPVLIVLENTRNESAALSLRLDLFLVRQPRAGLILPAFVLFFSGAVALLVRMLQGGLTRIVDDLATPDLYPPGSDGEPRAKDQPFNGARVRK